MANEIIEYHDDECEVVSARITKCYGIIDGKSTWYRHGESTWYYPDGEIKCVINYKFGLRDGIMTTYEHKEDDEDDIESRTKRYEYKEGYLINKY